jgi:heme/copper-type cytochrome/quinol oxidase subunit 2
MKRLAPFAAIVALVVLLTAAEAVGCPNCKDAVNTSDPDGLNLARGYFYSILLMLAMPLTLIGSFGCYVWREMRKQQREQAASHES